LKRGKRKTGEEIEQREGALANATHGKESQRYPFKNSKKKIIKILVGEVGLAKETSSTASL
jgi:hypothetical protein